MPCKQQTQWETWATHLQVLPPHQLKPLPEQRRPDDLRQQEAAAAASVGVGSGQGRCWGPCLAVALGNSAGSTQQFLTAAQQHHPPTWRLHLPQLGPLRSLSPPSPTATPPAVPQQYHPTHLRRLHLPQLGPLQRLHHPLVGVHLLDGGLDWHPQHRGANLHSGRARLSEAAPSMNWSGGSQCRGPLHCPQHTTAVPKSAQQYHKLRYPPPAHPGSSARCPPPSPAAARSRGWQPALPPGRFPAAKRQALGEAR